MVVAASAVASLRISMPSKRPSCPRWRLHAGLWPRRRCARSPRHSANDEMCRQVSLLDGGSAALWTASSDDERKRRTGRRERWNARNPALCRPCCVSSSGRPGGSAAGRPAAMAPRQLMHPQRRSLDPALPLGVPRSVSTFGRPHAAVWRGTGRLWLSRLFDPLAYSASTRTPLPAGLGGAELSQSQPPRQPLARKQSVGRSSRPDGLGGSDRQSSPEPLVRGSIRVVSAQPAKLEPDHDAGQTYRALDGGHPRRGICSHAAGISCGAPAFMHQGGGRTARYRLASRPRLRPVRPVRLGARARGFA